MEFAAKPQVVDPEVRAYVSSLVTALGGSGADEDGRYILGDDALACLRDLKKWLKLYDEKANRLDVARCLAESNLIGGDLLQILAAWPENATEDRLKSKIALACLELLVPLTWPLDMSKEMTVNHHKHMPTLEQAQLGYKRSIINFDGARILHTAVRCALPSMAESLGDRSTRDEGIIKLLLYFLRNIAMLAPPPNVQYEGDEAEISRSATIDAFDYQDIFHLLLTLSSTMGEDFTSQDIIVMDIIFHLVKGVDIERLFLSRKDVDNSGVDELKRLRKKEQAMLRGYKANAPSRHSRFGAMAWMQRDDGKMTTISGQSALTDSMKSLENMDSSKKFKPPRRAVKGEKGPLDFDNPAPLTASATKHLRCFVEDFLDAGFNPLFNHIRKALDREADRILTESHPRQFFYLVAWFLEAERVRRRNKKSEKPAKGAPTEETDSFALVASVLNQEMFVTLNRAMDSTLESKSWQDLSAAMKCFTQILLTVQEMSQSPLEDDQEIAENILARIFYEDTTHDRVATITRTYKDQGFGYLDSCTDLTHNYVRILEQYSKQNVDLQVRSRRRVRRKKKTARANGEDQPDDDIVDESDAEDVARAERTSSERKFDFKRFAAKFLSQGCIDTFVTFTSFYVELKPAQLKRAHRFFYRVAFKQDMSVMLFRVDIMQLFYKMMKGPQGMDRASPCYKEWDDLTIQLIKRCTRKIEQRPELIVEMLFSKTDKTAHFLEYGYEKQTASTKPRAAAELEVKGGLEWEDQIGVIVSAMLDRNEGEILEWVKSQLFSSESERRSWEAANQVLPTVEPAVQRHPSAESGDNEVAPTITAEPPSPPSIILRPSNDACKTAMFKNGHLRLLLRLVGFRCIGAPDDPTASWAVPSTLTAAQIKEACDLIKKFEFAPPTFDDGKEAGDLIKRVSAATSSRKRAVFDDENSNDDLDGDSDEEALFPAGGPTNKVSEAMKALKKSRRKRRREVTAEDGETTKLSDEQIDARNEARRQRESEKKRKIKSELFVHDSDDESDEERDRLFFAREEQLRRKTGAEIVKELEKVEKQVSGGKKQTAKRGSSAMEISGDDDVDEAMISKKASTTAIELDSDTEKEEEETAPEKSSATISQHSGVDEESDATPAQHISLDSSDEDASARPKANKRQRLSSPASKIQADRGKENEDVRMNDEEEEEIVVKPARRRVRAGFVVDSSDED